MNEPCRLSVVLVALAAVVARPSEGRAETPNVISSGAVVDLVMKQNPTVAAAIGERRRAELLEEGEEHRYPFTFQGDAKALRSGAPTLGPNGVTFPESTNLVAGAELRKKLVGHRPFAPPRGDAAGVRHAVHVRCRGCG